MKSVSPIELQHWIDQCKNIQIIDLREDYEVHSGSFSTLHLPMAEVLNRLDEIEVSCPVVMYCRSGRRAMAVVHTLTTRFGFDNIYLLQGGIEAYATSVNPQIEVYP